MTTARERLIAAFAQIIYEDEHDSLEPHVVERMARAIFKKCQDSPDLWVAMDGRIERLEAALRGLLKAAEGWHGTAWCEGQTDHEWEDEPAVLVAIAVLNGK